MKTFRIRGTKFRQDWLGKDERFRKEFTKEMGIDLEVQKKYPEMQIIGPSREKFMRRNEYGVGMMHDQRLSDILWM
ncbi:MAG: hypothetical protein H8E17_16980 [Deltaproteobacteria bacterium]|nr:hypothetical protein [Deltaproteobacteria bacterium]